MLERFRPNFWLTGYLYRVAIPIFKKFLSRKKWRPLPSQLNLRNWRRFLHDYDLKIICEYLEFGFTLNIDEELFTYNEELTNHAGARLQPTGVDKYFNVEVKKMAMVGPFTEKPFSKIHYSPLITRPKPDGEVRVIVDLSWPINNSVNTCIPKGWFDNMEFVLKYPTIDNLVNKIRDIGPQALIFKVDLERAFRNLRMDPAAYPFLG